MLELISRVAANHPSRPALLTHDVATSYAELAASAARVADRLRAEQVRRLAIADHEAATALPLLIGAAAAGVEACLYPPAPAEEIVDLVARFDHDVVASPRDDLAALPTGVRLVSPQLWLAPAGAGDDVTTGVTTGPRPHLVLTTGTTGAPKGVRHDWDRLLRSTARVAPGAGERWLLAYGLHQFAALQILLHVFAAGATLVAPAPRRPVEGLAAMRALGVTHASATPTYWRFLLAQLRADGGPVPALRQITLGGEAIPGPLLGQLAEVFPEATISQVYAASEFGATGSMRDGRPGLSTAVLERGEDADVAMKVVDGELWVRSRIGMLGYHGEPPLAESDGWRPTGDLVEIVDDRILFRGRASEIINVGGVKVHPLPIEERVSAVPGVAVARVHGRPNKMTGAIVALEVVPEAGVDRSELETALRAACADLPSAARPRSIRFVDGVTTAGDKIVRRNVDE